MWSKRPESLPDDIKTFSLGHYKLVNKLSKSENILGSDIVLTSILERKDTEHDFEFLNFFPLIFWLISEISLEFGKWKSLEQIIIWLIYHIIQNFLFEFDMLNLFMPYKFFSEIFYTFFVFEQFYKNCSVFNKQMP